MIVAQRKTVARKTHVATANAWSKTVPVTRHKGQAILNAQAMKYLGMSGDEFATKYRAGEIPDPDRSEVARVAILLPYAKQ